MHCSNRGDVIRFLMLVFVCFVICLSVGAQDTKFSEAETFIQHSKYRNAKNILDELLKSNPDSDKYYVARAACFEKMQNVQGAYDDLNKAIAINPKNAKAYFIRASILLRSGNAQESINDLDMVIKYAKADTLINSAYLNRASSKLKLRNFEGVIQDCSLLLERDSVHVGALNNLALAYNETGQPDKALPYLYRLVKIDTTNFFGFMNIGFVMLSKENYTDAISWLDKAIKLAPQESFTYNNRGYAKLKLGDTKEALKDVNKSISINNHNSYAYRNRALIYFAMNENAKACEDLNKAISLGFTEQYGDEVKKLQSEKCH